MHPKVHKQFSGKDADGFITQEKVPDRFKRWLQESTQGNTQIHSLGRLQDIIDKAKRNIWSLSNKDRKTFMIHLTQEIRERIIDGILDDFREDDAFAKQI
jgi:predicted nucleic acid-binding OB-fold protein